MKKLRWILALSVLANLVLGVLYWRRPYPLPTEPPVSQATVTVAPAETKKLQLENDQFDFSSTALSDEAWKIEAPELPPSPVADSEQ